MSYSKTQLKTMAARKGYNLQCGAAYVINNRLVLMYVLTSFDGEDAWDIETKDDLVNWLREQENV